MGITINDIAKAAKVSKATVSYVLNHKPGVSDRTQKRILDLIKQLDFQPNTNARGLAGKPTGMLGLVIPDISDMFYLNILRGVENQANLYNYTINLCTTHARPEKERAMVETFSRGRADGVIIMTYFLEPDFIENLKTKQVPFVFIDSLIDDELIHTVTVNNEEAAYNATTYLINLGHEQIAFIKGLADNCDSADRFRGYCRALQDNDLPYVNDYVYGGDFSKSGGYLAARELISLKNPPTAIFAANDQMALGVLSAVKDAGLQIPENISIIGFDDIDAAFHAVPPLTTVRQPAYEMGKKAVELLMDLVNGVNSPERKVTLKAQLIERASCMAIKR